MRSDARALVAAVGEPPGQGDLGSAYRAAVAKVQSQPFDLPPGPSTPNLHFDVREPAAAAALAYLLGEQVDPAELQLDAAASAFARERFESAWGLLEQRGPRFLDSVRVLVGHFVFADHPPHEGQTSLRNALGTVFWISPFDNWRARHFADAIVHEATHQALFLADMIHGCFSVDRQGLDAPSALALSSVRGIPRPYDLAFHAACVDAVLLSLFDSLGYRRELQRRAEALAPALEDLAGKGEPLLSPAGREILREAIETMESAERRIAEAAAGS
ncbi:MAG TPA: HEXXH motif-containing putative peptide modification protein [Solirubrobacterales bacterium]|nr:HEXXH motif-containing putative peptide modification protein [Solirubrobacterales bacterium]